MNDQILARQGGDLRGRGPVQLDLSTCVNPYGPSEAVLDALRSMPAEAVRQHPFGAAAEVEAAYADYLSLPATELIAGQGISDLIWGLAQHFHGKTIGLPMPSYTEFRQAFPEARAFGGGPATHAPQVLDDAMRNCDAVILSNPHNPTGQVIQKNDLVDIALRHPGAILVVDESYIDFLADAASITVTGCEADNVVAFRSPSKFFSLAGVRSGVAWTLHGLRESWRSRRTNWPVSAFAATALRTAFSDTAWTSRMRQYLAEDGVWLEDLVAGSGLAVAPGSLHFRLLTGPGAGITGLAGSLEMAGIAVRVLEEAYGVGIPAVRISSPNRQDRWRLAAALGGPVELG